MASSSSAFAALALGHPVTEKLSKNNYLLWKIQVLPAVRDARLGFLDGTIVAPSVEIDVKVGDRTEKQPNPAHNDWVAKDQLVLSYLLSTISKAALTHVSNAETAADAWKSPEDVYASQTCARAVNTRIALATIRKENMMIAEYFKMKALGDEMASVCPTS